MMGVRECFVQRFVAETVCMHLKTAENMEGIAS